MRASSRPSKKAERPRGFVWLSRRQVVPPPQFQSANPFALFCSQMNATANTESSKQPEAFTLQQEQRALSLGEHGSIQDIAAFLATEEGRAAVFSARRQDKYGAGESPILLAICNDRFEEAALLAPHSDMSVRDGFEGTPLMAATGRGAFELAKTLLPLSDPNARGRSGYTALHVAVEAAGAEEDGLVELLLPVSDAKINRSASTQVGYFENEGPSPLMTAVTGQKIKTLRLLLPDSDIFATSQPMGQSALSEAIGDRWSAGVDELLKCSYAKAPKGFWLRVVLAAVRARDSDALSRVMPFIEGARDLDALQFSWREAVSSKSACGDIIAASMAGFFGRVENAMLYRRMRRDVCAYPRFNAAVDARQQQRALARVVASASKAAAERAGDETSHSTARASARTRGARL